VQREPKLRPMNVAPALHTTTRASASLPPAPAREAREMHEEPSAMVPSRSQPRMAQPSEKALQVPRIVGREPSLPLDEDQFDIPTFLRRQGQTDLP
jgi:cell division protein FtsZ